MIKKIQAQTLLAHRSSSFLRFFPHHPNSTHRKREKSVEISQIFFDQRRRRSKKKRRKRIKRRCCPQSRKGARSPLHLELTPCSLSTSVELSRSLSLSLSQIFILFSDLISTPIEFPIITELIEISTFVNTIHEYYTHSLTIIGV